MPSLLARIIRPTRSGRQPPPWVYPVTYAAVAAFGSFTAALIAHFTIMPGFLGSVRSILLLAMFSVIFCGLFLGLASAVSFYRQAIDKVRVEEEMNLARRIQRSFLLTSFPRRPRTGRRAIPSCWSW